MLRGTVALQATARDDNGMWAAVFNSANPEVEKGCKHPENCDPHFERLELMRVPKPQLSVGTARVKVMASSVNQKDWSSHQYDSLNEPYPMMFGMDWAGVVEEIMAPCEFQPGDEVYSFNCGSYAQYVVALCSEMGRKPANLNFTEAAVLPLAALTSLRALEYSGAPWLHKPTVLVLGGAGGTGHFAVQLAKAMGAQKVIATASKNHASDCYAFGADEVIDYKYANWWDSIGSRSVDVILNCIPQADAFRDQSGDRAYQVLALDGWFLYFNPGEQPTLRFHHQEPTVKYTYVEPNKTIRQFFFLNSLIMSGRLRPKVSNIYHFNELRLALMELGKKHTAGKIAIDMSDLADLGMGPPIQQDQTVEKKQVLMGANVHEPPMALSSNSMSRPVENRLMRVSTHNPGAVAMKC